MNQLNYCSRGIDVVRNKIKMFAQQKVTLPKGRHKIIILDEADRYVVFSWPQLLCEMCHISPVCRAPILDSIECFYQAVQNNLLGNEYGLNSDFMGVLTASRDHCFKRDAEYWRGMLWIWNSTFQFAGRMPHPWSCSRPGCMGSEKPSLMERARCEAHNLHEHEDNDF